MTTQPTPADSAQRLDTPSSRVADPAQEALVRSLRASFNVLRVLMIVLVGLYVINGLFTVRPDERGLVARLGRLQPGAGGEGGLVFTPGTYVRLPEPFDRQYHLPGPEKTQQLRITTFMFNHEQAATAPDLAAIVAKSTSLQPGVDGAMFTGDRNLSHGRWEVQYRISDPVLLLQNVAEFRKSDEPPPDLTRLIARLTETAVVREVASRTVEQVTRTALEDVRAGVKRRLQAALNRLNTGVQVVQVTALTIEPGDVRQAFEDVVRAENDKQRIERQADEQATKTLNKAAGQGYADLRDAIRAYGDAQTRGEPETQQRALLATINQKLEAARAGDVAIMLTQAGSEASQTGSRVQREYTEFVEYLKQRQVQPTVTLLGLWTQMRDEVLRRKENEIFFVPDSNEIEILVKSDRQRQIELEQERALKRQRGETPESPVPPPPPPRSR